MNVRKAYVHLNVLKYKSIEESYSKSNSNKNHIYSILQKSCDCSKFTVFNFTQVYYFLLNKSLFFLSWFSHLLICLNVEILLWSINGAITNKYTYRHTFTITHLCLVSNDTGLVNFSKKSHQICLFSTMRPSNARKIF